VCNSSGFWFLTAISFVCLQLYDIRCNSLTVGGIQLAMILLRIGSLLYQKMLPHGDALPVRKTEERFLQCSLRRDLQKGRQFCVPASSSTCSWKNPDGIELSSNKFWYCCCWLLLIRRSQSLLRLEKKWVVCKESSSYRQLLCFFQDSYWRRMDQFFFSWQNFQGHANLPAKVE
jgi:hypothetical protein